MIDRLLSLIAPHPCSGCGKIGTLLCDNCKYNIIIEKYDSCLVCGVVTDRNGTCSVCHPSYTRGWCVGERTGELRQLIDSFKFENVKSAYLPLGDLLSSHLGDLPKNIVIVPVPTIPSHIRQRGYDHTLLLARHLAKKQQLQLDRPLRRANNTRQRGATKSTRLSQAEIAFRVQGKLRSDTTYLLIDDVVTTGATLEYAARALRHAGASEVWAAVIARQPLD